MKNVEMEQKDTDATKSKTQEPEESHYTWYIFSLMVFLSTTGTGLMIHKLNEFVDPLKLLRPEYEFPSIYDFKITLIVLPFFCVRINLIKIINIDKIKIFLKKTIYFFIFFS